jgi:hypothetical protein
MHICLGLGNFKIVALFVVRVPGFPNQPAYLSPPILLDENKGLSALSLFSLESVLS